MKKKKHNSKKNMAKKKTKIRLNRKKILFLFIGYSVIVLVFSVIYYLMFRYDNTSFVISEQLNKHIDRQSLLNPNINLASFNKEAKGVMPINVNDFILYIWPDLDKLSSINDSLKNNKNRIELCQAELSEIVKKSDKIRQDSANSYRERVLQVYKEQIDSLKRFMEGKDSTQMIMDGKYIELAHLQLNYANANAAVSNYIIKAWGSFIPDSLMDKIMYLNNEWTEISTINDELEGSRRHLSDRIKSSIIAFDKNRLASISYRDFLYFSICVSTTVSFGDIAPNSNKTRNATIIELLLCVVLVGVFIGLVQKETME